MSSYRQLLPVVLIQLIISLHTQPLFFSISTTRWFQYALVVSFFRQSCWKYQITRFYARDEFLALVDLRAWTLDDLIHNNKIAQGWKKIPCHLIRSFLVFLHSTTFSQPIPSSKDLKTTLNSSCFTQTHRHHLFLSFFPNTHGLLEIKML